MDWKPIDADTPRDGTWLLLSGGITDEDDYNEIGIYQKRAVTAFWDADVCSGSWRGEDNDCWAMTYWDGDWRSYYLDPTHWAPLTPPTK